MPVNSEMTNTFIWTEDRVKQLRELCFAEVPNKEIANQLGCDVKYIYAKRSQLGITRDKVKAAKAKHASPEHEKDAQNNAVQKAFCNLYDTLLIAVAHDSTTERDANLYSCMAGVVSDLQVLLNTARGTKHGQAC